MTAPFPSTPITVWLIEDNPTFRKVVARLLNETPGFRCPEALDSAEAALRRLQHEIPDVILLDVALPGVDGLSAIRHIHARAPQVRIIMLTVYDDEEKIRRAIQAGAAGYLLKTSTEENIAAAIRSVMDGQPAMTQEVADSLWHMLANSPTAVEEPCNLTPREREILRFVTEGLATKEIAARLHVSPHTADTHLRHIYHKLGVNTRASAVAKALQQRLV